MAHFAKVLDGKVLNIIVAEPEFFETFIDSSPGQWVQTSYNTRGGIHYDPVTGSPSSDQTKALRKNFASVSANYDSTSDAFYSNQPYPSWLLNQDTFLWEAPTPMPEKVHEHQQWEWDESTTSWVSNNYTE